jgi:hypothetical protein
MSSALQRNGHMVAIDDFRVEAKPSPDTFLCLGSVLDSSFVVESLHRRPEASPISQQRRLLKNPSIDFWLHI